MKTPIAISFFLCLVLLANFIFAKSIVATLIIAGLILTIIVYLVLARMGNRAKS